MIKLEEGKRYRRRDGLVTAPLRRLPASHNATYAFWDEKYWNSYRTDGTYFELYSDHPLDIVSEYHG